MEGTTPESRPHNLAAILYPRINPTILIALVQQNYSDDNFDVAGRAARASTAAEDEEAALAAMVVPPPVRFCSADACSVRKDITRKARRLLPSPTTPSGAELGQQVGPVTGLLVDAATHFEIEDGGGGSSSN